MTVGRYYHIFGFLVEYKDLIRVLVKCEIISGEPTEEMKEFYCDNYCYDEIPDGTAKIEILANWYEWEGREDIENIEFENAKFSILFPPHDMLERKDYKFEWVIVGVLISAINKRTGEVTIEGNKRGVFPLMDNEHFSELFVKYNKQNLCLYSNRYNEVEKTIEFKDEPPHNSTYYLAPQVFIIQDDCECCS